MERTTPWVATTTLAAAAALAAGLAIVGWMIFVFAPREVTMGDVQRIVYLHVAVAWCGLAGCLAMGITGALYLLKGTPRWDEWSQAAGEMGWLCTTLTLATGSLWAHEAWNTWWTWEPRLTASLILWMLFAAYFLVRSNIESAERRARVGAVLAVLTLADLPLVVMATRWFRGIHPVSPEMDWRMRLVLLMTVLSFTLLFGWMVKVRRNQLRLATRLLLLS
jgi:heme exporter protein C